MSSSADTRTPQRRRIAGERRSRSTTAAPEVTPAPRVAEAEAKSAVKAPTAVKERKQRKEKAPKSTTTAGAGTGRRRWVAPVVALVASLAALGVVLGVSLRDPGAQDASDRAAASQARTSIEQLLSYNYKTIDAQQAQVQGLLTGSFKGEFTQAMDKDIKPLAVKNQTVVQAKVSDIGVMSSSPTTVKVLAFVNQARVGADTKNPVVDQNRVMATMRKVGDRWLISKVEAF